ncbi:MULTISPECIES: response regulator transcription factor [unclassified Frondihabitans]|uniref:response regulator transcription factor n=1 Tax=unclassified Frondihabitans TaxID=2626248 RepID=UPI000F4D98DD|nr:MULTISPECIES: response regulator transcription factor [unclassified Frondihabitans]RPE77811.1 LuxR family two component transcriptional regulator [Frondihabitans sp. PhB153]RPF08090.1 LuxR family two component transcriptional regulator [Frondihabitans sp. PhB161]
MTTSLLLVDDQPMIRMGLRTILDSQPEFQVVGEAGDGLEAVAFTRENSVDVILMDIRMPGVDGVEATRRIREFSTAEATRIIVLTTFEHDEVVVAALRAGANGFLGKTVGPKELVAGIREVVAGGGALSAAAQAAVIAEVSAPATRVIDPNVLAQFDALTPKEREVVIAIAGGSDNDAVGRTLFISPFTVKTHANRAMLKLGARDRAQLVSLVFRAGLDA